MVNRGIEVFQPLGYFDAPGPAIFGRGQGSRGQMNDFAGVGGGKPVPSNGITFGFKPGSAGGHVSPQDLSDEEKLAVKRRKDAAK